MCEEVLLYDDPAVEAYATAEHQLYKALGALRPRVRANRIDDLITKLLLLGGGWRAPGWK